MMRMTSVCMIFLCKKREKNKLTTRTNSDLKILPEIIKNMFMKKVRTHPSVRGTSKHLRFETSQMKTKKTMN